MAAVAQGQSQACFWMCRNSEVKDQAGKCRHSVSPKIIEPWNRFYSTRCPALSTSSCYRQGGFLLPGWDDSSELGTSRFLTAAGAPLPILDRFCDFGKEVAWLVQAGCSHIALQHLCQKDSTLVTSRWLHLAQDRSKFDAGYGANRTPVPCSPWLWCSQSKTCADRPSVEPCAVFALSLDFEA